MNETCCMKVSFRTQISTKQEILNLEETSMDNDLLAFYESSTQ